MLENDYEILKNDPNVWWEENLDDMLKISKSWGRKYGKPYEEYLSDIYLYFKEAAQRYNPYYSETFKPARYYIFGYIKQSLQAESIKRNKFNKRYVACEHIPDELYEDDYNLFNITSILNERQLEVIRLTLEGYKEAEIGKKLNFSQTWINQMKKDIRLKLIEANIWEEWELKNRKRRHLVNKKKRVLLKDNPQYFTDAIILNVNEWCKKWKLSKGAYYKCRRNRLE